jgi:arabinan endo-1,5-alpha-L-arabinosidase
MPGTAQQFKNPLITTYFADPFVFYGNGRFWAVATERDTSYWNDKPARVIPIRYSADLHHWEDAGHALTVPEELRGTHLWAPEVTVADGKYYLYYAASDPAADPNHITGFCMRVAVADAPGGPYTDTGTPLTSMTKDPFAIDGHAFQDDDGTWYFFYAADFRERNDNNAHLGTALVVDRMANLTTLSGNPKTVARARYPWQMYEANRAMPHYNIQSDWYTLEGPVVRKRGGKYYCFYSGGNYQNETYGVDYVVADSIAGPWDCSGGKDGPRVLRTIPNKIAGPGHCSIITHDGTDYIVYHAWDQAMTARQMWIDELAWTSDGPCVARFQ